MPDDEIATPADASDDAARRTDEPEHGAEPETPAEQESDHPSRREAAYRTKLRSAEAARDQLAEQVEALQRQTVEDHAARYGLYKPSAIWSIGVEVADMLDDQGLIDTEAVRTACTNAARELGIARRPKPNSAQGGDDAPPLGKSWEAAFDHRQH